AMNTLLSKAVCAVGLLLASVQLSSPAAAQAAGGPHPAQFRVIGTMPPAPAHPVQRHRRLPPVQQSRKFVVIDDFGRTFAAGRDSFGNLVPVFFDQVSGTSVPVFFDPARDVFFVLLRDTTGRFFRCIQDPPFEGCFLDTTFQPASFAFVPPVIVFPAGITPATVLQAAPVVVDEFLAVQ